jgi:5-methyltetrahydropteroyltriglutamate--homocysteine methyltransferase
MRRALPRACTIALRMSSVSKLRSASTLSMTANTARPSAGSRYVLQRMSGFEQRDRPGHAGMPAAAAGRDRREFAEFYADYDRHQGFTGMIGWALTGPIRYTGHAAIQRDIANFKAAASVAKAKALFMAAVAPASVAPDRIDEYYKSDEEYIFAVADALHDEYKAIIDAGLILQVDDAYLALTYEVMVPPKKLSDYRKWAAVRIEALNHALRGLPEERTRYHVCWGSWNGPHAYDVELKNIVDLILKVRVGGYLLEMANPRHEHEWRVWESVKLPIGRMLVPGVISRNQHRRASRACGRASYTACQASWP